MTGVQTCALPIYRLDEIVMFDAIDKKMFEKIVDVQLADMASLLKNEKDITIKVTDAAKKQLTIEGFDPAYGARPLKRVIQSRILDTLAEKIISGEIHEHDAINIDYKEKMFTVTKTK